MTGTVIQRPGLTAATRRPGVPPTVAYLAERARLGMASIGNALLHHCPWCGAGIGEMCHVRTTGQRLTCCHEARQLRAEAPS